VFFNSTSLEKSMRAELEEVAQNFVILGTEKSPDKSSRLSTEERHDIGQTEKVTANKSPVETKNT